MWLNYISFDSAHICSPHYKTDSFIETNHFWDLKIVESLKHWRCYTMIVNTLQIAHKLFTALLSNHYIIYLFIGAYRKPAPKQLNPGLYNEFMPTLTKNFVGT